jgi:hypothetical protein
VRRRVTLTECRRSRALTPSDAPGGPDDDGSERLPALDGLPTAAGETTLKSSTSSASPNARFGKEVGPLLQGSAHQRTCPNPRPNPADSYGTMSSMEILATAPLLVFVWRLPKWGRLWLEFLRDLRSYRAGF